ncbi:Stk1 family PASTA domain-containing Ser/Thr kinase [Actinomadura decatromicini]|uniref:non-specific serine/threonine protein kinase n=1 Tax=Actinomadura decatromicini TaxID=2604572 RepID=A0A5D3FJS1_9ACTN|nr:Stk1 family PASTA domain-containing Ser/Thr kinase [Actinomadura decatromicini]TYK47950.1 Stk1 family PASTA domain-containing Ser/Thr kinase [Actinomadura decatromicini]
MDATGADPLVGRVLDGRYRIESRVARGGMATVYVARDIRLDRVVAIKIMHAGLAADEDFVARFIGEAKAAAALSHPNVVAVYDQRTDGEHVFLVMEYVAGHTLRDALGALGRLGPRAALEIMQPVLAALGAAHRAGLVHRDVKPENVLITEDGQVKVADFGLARAETASKMTKTGVLIGTVGYLAPEQVMTGDADVRSDVYAAGVMLFELLTGRLPHQGDTPLAVAYKHVNETVPAPSSVVPGIPLRVDELVTDATSHDPDRRPRDANQYLAEVAEVFGGLPRDIDRRIEEASRTETSVLETPPMGPPPGGRTAVLDAATLPREYAPAPERTRADRAIGALTGRYVLVVLGTVAAITLGWAVWYQTSGQYEHVPKSIVGMKLTDARDRLESSGLRVRTAKAVYDDRVHKGDVVKTDPPAGSRIAGGETVTLTPSRGITPRKVPDVSGKSLPEAKQTLEDEGFKVGRTTSTPSQTVERDRVIGTDPDAGERRSPDEPVGIILSTGMSMPGLIGQDGDTAANRLRSMGLNVKVEKKKVDGKPSNSVVEQNPAEGEGVSRGDEVTLVVNKRDCLVDAGPIQWGCDDDEGEQDIPVPDLTGRRVDDAKKALEDSGFRVNVTGFGGDNVRFQSPRGGEAPRGSTVTIVRGP